MRALGAAGCVDYATGDVAAQAVTVAGGQVDAIAALVGGPHLAAALGALRPGGQIASIATPDLDLDPLLDANITFHGVLIGDDGQRTRNLAGLLAAGQLRPVISHTCRWPRPPRRTGSWSPGTPAARSSCLSAGSG